MALSKGQALVAHCDARWRVCISGRRFGKTHLAIREICKVAKEPHKNVYAIYPSYRQAKAVLWKRLKNRLNKLQWVAKINETELSITLTSGSVIALKGADNFDSLRGTHIDFAVFDEFTDIDSEAWTALRPSMSSNGGGSALFIGTPKGRNWAYDLFLKGQGNDPEWKSFQFTSIEGGNMTEAEIEQARRDFGEREFAQEYLATFVDFSGVIYYNFKDDNIVPFTGEITEKQELMLMLDFNIDPMAAVVGVRTATGVHIIDELVIYGSNTNEIIDEMRNRYPKNRIVAYPDPAGKAGNNVTGRDVTPHILLKNAGFHVKVRPTHPAVKSRIAAVNSLLRSSTGDIRLLVDPKCKTLINSLYKQCYKRDTHIPDKSGGFDHINDALGYGIEYEFSIQRNIEFEPQEYWGFRTA